MVPRNIEQLLAYYFYRASNWLLLYTGPCLHAAGNHQIPESLTNNSIKYHTQSDRQTKLTGLKLHHITHGIKLKRKICKAKIRADERWATRMVSSQTRRDSDKRDNNILHAVIIIIIIATRRHNGVGSLRNTSRQHFHCGGGGYGLRP